MHAKEMKFLCSYTCIRGRPHWRTDLKDMKLEERESITETEARHRESLNSNTGSEDGQYDLLKCLLVRYLGV